MLHHVACLANQHSFWKLSLVNLISKDVNPVFYHWFTLQNNDYDFASIQRRHPKRATLCCTAKDTCIKIDNVYQYNAQQ